MVFEVYVDGALRYRSARLTGASTTQHVDVSVAGAVSLRLVVTSSGDGYSQDHGDWAGAKLS